MKNLHEFQAFTTTLRYLIVMGGVFVFALFISCGRSNPGEADPPPLGAEKRPPTPIPPLPNPLDHDIDNSQQELLEKIKSYHTIASRLVMDGLADDWSLLPAFHAKPQAQPQANLKADINVITVAIAPMAESLVVMFKTAQAPDRSDERFWFDWDFAGSHAPDIRIGLSLSGNAVLVVYQSGRPAIVKSIAGITVAISEVLEAKIPYASLMDHLPYNLGQHLREPVIRGWMRIYTSVKDNFGSQVYGINAASYRLLADPALLPIHDGLPNSQHAPIEVPTPFSDTFFVSQGAYTEGSHQNGWHYDLMKIEADYNPTRPAISSSLNNLTYGAPLIAPINARVIEANDSQNDAALNHLDQMLNRNFLRLRLGNGYFMRFLYLRQGSIRVKVNDSINAGEPLAQIGAHSLRTSAHLHWDVLHPSQAITLPLALNHVWVQLNPVPTDPWKRAVARWRIREGYFVSPQEVRL